MRGYHHPNVATRKAKTIKKTKKQQHSTSSPCNQLNVDQLAMSFYPFLLAATATNSFNRLCSGNNVSSLHDESTAPPFISILNVKNMDVGLSLKKKWQKHNKEKKNIPIIMP